MTTKKTIKVKALTQHTFAGNLYNEGDTYEVEGDATQTAEQYAVTLGALRFAALDDGKKAEKAEKEAEPMYATRELKAAKR